jgi:hypothetical protein
MRGPSGGLPECSRPQLRRGTLSAAYKEAIVASVVAREGLVLAARELIILVLVVLFLVWTAREVARHR